ncbi:MAG: glycosyltransferase family 4 protein [Acidimicrobiia bacterium]
MKLVALARGLGSQPTGRGQVAWLLLEELRRIRPEWAIVLLSAANPGLRDVEWGRGTGNGPLGEALFLLRRAARTVSRHDASVFWAGTHLVPFGMPSHLPKVVTFHDAVWRDHPETMRNRNRVASRAGERGLAGADRILCNSHFTHSRLAAHWPEYAKRATVMPLASNPHYRTDLDPDRTLAKFGITRPFVFNVDTVEPRKNLSVFLDCADAFPGMTFLQCGRLGWSVDGLVQRARNTPNVRLLGYVEEQHLNALYLAASAALFPSKYEGFHLSPLDAARLGCPVIASDIPVHREVLGEAARYGDPLDPPSFAGALRDVLENPAETRRLVATGRARADTFSWRRTAEIFATTTESLL